MGENFLNDISSERTHQIHSKKKKKNQTYSWGGSLPKLFKELGILKFWIFAIFFFFFFVFANMGPPWEQKFQKTSPMNVCTRFAPQNSRILLGRVST